MWFGIMCRQAVSSSNYSVCIAYFSFEASSLGGYNSRSGHGYGSNRRSRNSGSKFGKNKQLQEQLPLNRTLYPYIEANRTRPLIEDSPQPMDNNSGEFEPTQMPHDDLQIGTADLKQAIMNAHSEFPQGNFWQADMIEIALIPSVKRAIEQMNNGRALNIQRVQTPFGNGYVLEGWNRVRDDYYSTNPASVWDGIRREFIGAQDIESLRAIGLGNDYAKTQLRHFKVEA